MFKIQKNNLYDAVSLIQKKKTEKEDNKVTDFETILKNLLTNNNENQFMIQQASYEEISKCFVSLKKDCYSGHDDIPARFVKPVVKYLTSPIVHFVNSCIEKKIFPRQWKTAHVCVSSSKSRVTNLC